MYYNTKKLKPGLIASLNLETTSGPETEWANSGFGNS